MSKNPEQAPTTYTGGRELRSNHHRNPSLLNLLPHLHRLAERYAVKDKHPRITAAGGMLARADEAHAAVTEWIAERDDVYTDAANQYADKKITAAAFARKIGEAVAVAGTDRAKVRKAADRVAGVLQRKATEELRQITEAEWLALIRPVADELLAEAAEAADALTAERDRLNRSGRTAPDDAPSSIELDAYTVRIGWELLNHRLLRAYEVLGLVGALHSNEAAPAVPGRTLAEHVWWRDLDALDGRPSQFAEFYLRNRHRGQLGVWSSDELKQYDAEATERRLKAEAAATRAALDQHRRRLVDA